MRPTALEYDPYYSTYVSLVPEFDVVAVLERQPGEVRALAGRVAPHPETHRYKPGKWSVRDVIGHIVDTDRVFGHRAFCISCGERQALPGFSQDEYIAAVRHQTRSLAELVRELEVVRESNLIVFRRLASADWDRTGTASGHPVSVRALAFMMAGHVRHHVNILRERYGLDG